MKWQPPVMVAGRVDKYHPKRSIEQYYNTQTVLRNQKIKSPSAPTRQFILFPTTIEEMDLETAQM